MKLAEIQNGLAFAGNTRKRNYKERACCPKPQGLSQPSYGQLNKAYKLACKTIAVQDEFIKSSATKSNI